MLTFDAGDQLLHLRRFGVIDSYGNAAAPGGGNQFRGFFDGFGTAGRGALPSREVAGAAAGAVNRSACFSQRDRDASAGAASGSS